MNKGFLSLFEPEDLLEKLEHDYNELLSDINNVYKAFNFFVTAEHLPDWVGSTTIKDKNPYLRICSHLATGAKHFKVINPKKNSIEDTAIAVYVEDGYVEKGYVQPVLDIILTESESIELGIKTILITDLAEKVISFWKNYFEAKNT